MKILNKNSGNNPAMKHKKGCEQFTSFFISYQFCYAPKSSNINISRGTPKSQSIFSTALAIGPGPHM